MYKAHYDKYTKREQSVAEHLSAVSELAGFFASFLGNDVEILAQIAGLLHDIGKYGDLFQDRIMGQNIHVDHSTAGAQII